MSFRSRRRTAGLSAGFGRAEGKQDNSSHRFEVRCFPRLALMSYVSVPAQPPPIQAGCEGFLQARTLHGRPARRLMSQQSHFQPMKRSIERSTPLRPLPSRFARSQLPRQPTTKQPCSKTSEYIHTAMDQQSTLPPCPLHHPNSATQHPPTLPLTTLRTRVYFFLSALRPSSVSSA